MTFLQSIYVKYWVADFNRILDQKATGKTVQHAKMMIR
jgi:hypothetical protein